MKKLIAAIAMLISAAFLPGCAQMQSAMGDSTALTSLVTKQLGVSDSQATGGIGAMLKLAQEKLSAGDFDQVAKAIPGTSKYLDSAKKLLGGGNVGDAAGLQSAFSKLGLSPDMVGKFKTILTQFAGQSGNSNAASLLAGALK
ncbi:MAG TPA: DUF2780 domain-containing protein [Burkholderiales bacterium]|nr:DUF2780 domain-containing protein [Burkholderiales bacterium]